MKTYVELGSLYFGVAGVIAFLGHLLGPGKWRMFTWLWKVHVGYGVVSLTLNFSDSVDAGNTLQLYQYLLLVTMLAVLFQIIVNVIKGNPEARIVVFGLVALVVLAMLDVFESLQLTHFGTPSFVHIGIFFFICSLVVILFKRMVKVAMLIKRSEKLSLVGQLAAGVAHEIRNPITVISGFLKMLQRDPSQTQYMRLIRSEVERIEAIVMDFLFLAKPDSPIRQEVDLEQLIHDVIMLFQSQALEKGIRIREMIPEELPVVWCESIQIKQVCINVLKNAIEAMPLFGGEIKFKLQHLEKERMIRIECEDHGVGISDEVAGKIGEPFFTTKENGTGLGLMVSSRIMEQHGGSIKISSNEHGGTTVELQLPIGEPEK